MWQNKSIKNKDCGIDGGKGKKAPSPVCPPSTAKEAPLRVEEMERRIEEAEQLEGVGQSPSFLPTWQLAQMAAEARSSKSGREEPAHKKLKPTVGGKVPWKEFLWAGQVKKPRRYWPGIVALCEIWQF